MSILKKYITSTLAIAFIASGTAMFTPPSQAAGAKYIKQCKRYHTNKNRIDRCAEKLERESKRDDDHYDTTITMLGGGKNGGGNGSGGGGRY